ncbi:MAG: hypothetical protein R2710_25875 [Acidimicrobiales bacterium]
MDHIRRRSGSVLLARDGVDAPVSGVELANYAAALADAAGSLVSDHDVVTRVQLLDHLQSIAAPVFDAPLPDAHLADLAADLCAEASLNSRLELYRTDLEPVAALRATRRAFVAPKPLTIEDVQAKVAARFPAAMPLPGRPDLDAALGAAGVGLSWDSAAGAYINPLHRGTSSSTLAGSYSRYATNVTADIPRVEIDNAQDFEDRLGRSHNNGGLLVLVAKPIDVKKATSQLTRLADVTVSVDSWLTEQLDELTANGKPSWQVLTEADAAGEVGPHWGNLRNVVNRALDGFTQRLIATDGTVLLTDPGLLARFDRLDLVASWRSALHEGGNPLQALWLLVPAATATDVPMLDGRAVPVISRNEWSHLPEDWLRNAHRSGVAS